MTTSFIDKVGVWDPRLVQEEPTFLVQKGALSNTVMPFQAISANASQHTYQLQVPNLGVFVDRQIRWASGVYLTFNTYYSGITAGAQGMGAGVGNTLNAVPPPPNYVYVNGSTVGYAASTGLASTGVYENQLATMVMPGQDICLTMFPLTALCTNMQVSINDANVTTNGDVLREMILLSNTPAVRKIRTTPSRWEKFALCRADAGDGTTAYPGAQNGNFRDYSHVTEGDIPNGSWPVTFYNPGTVASVPDLLPGQSAGSLISGAVAQRYAAVQPGAALVGSGLYQDPNGIWVRYFNGVPCWGYFTSDTVASGGVAANAGQAISAGDPSGVTPSTAAFTVVMRYDVMEPITVSPFLWRESMEMSSVGLFGCTNMQFTMNLQAPSSATAVKASTASTAGQPYWKDLQVSYPNSAQVIKCSGVNTVLGNVRILGPTTTSTTPGFVNPRILAQFLTPAPGISVPLISSVPYTDFPRYFSNYGASLNTGAITTMQSQTITLSSCPDLLLVWVKPNLIGSTTNIPYVPITAVRVTFDNFSNLCSNFSQQHLYTCTENAGIDIPWLEWAGYAHMQASGTSIYGPNGMLVGAPLALRMGVDVTLSPGLAPGCLGNYSTQVSVDLDNTRGWFNQSGGLFPATGYTMTIMPVSAGMFETCQGSSTIRRTILNTSDVISVTSTNSLTTAHLHRMVGAGMKSGGSAWAVGKQLLRNVTGHQLYTNLKRGHHVMSMGGSNMNG